MKLSDFDFKLPDELIALNPAKPRDSSKLLRVNSSDFFEDTTFSQLTNFLNDGDVLVVNDTKVIPSKIIGFKVNAEKELTRISFTFFENKENQTIYQNKEGSIASPTAGLHFTDNLIEKIIKKGVKIEKLTLNIGLGTFLPLRDDNVKENTLHSEYCYLSSKTAKILNKAKNSKDNRIICVGTTALRTLETSFENGEFKPINKKTNKFIYPGIDINSIDALITNFHLPKSSLFILVCALMGTNKMLNAYNYAIKNKYRFYSYGDACLLEK